MVKKSKKSFNNVANKGKVTMHDLNIVNEMTKDAGKHFNKEQNF